MLGGEILCVVVRAQLIVQAILLPENEGEEESIGFFQGYKDKNIKANI